MILPVSDSDLERGNVSASRQHRGLYKAAAAVAAAIAVVSLSLWAVGPEIHAATPVTVGQPKMAAKFGNIDYTKPGTYATADGGTIIIGGGQGAKPPKPVKPQRQPPPPELHAAVPATQILAKCLGENDCCNQAVCSGGNSFYGVECESWPKCPEEDIRHILQPTWGEKADAQYPDSDHDRDREDGADCRHCG